MEQEQIGDLVRYTSGSGIWEGVIISKNELKFTKVPIDSSYKIGDLFEIVPPLCSLGSNWEVIERADSNWVEKIKMEKRARFINRIEKRHIKCTK